MNLTFAQPAWLLLVLLAVPVAWLAARWFHAMSRARRWSAVAARAGLLALLGGALAGASSVRTSDRLAVIVVVDVSGSMREFAAEFADLGRDPQGDPRRLFPTLRTWIDQIAEDRGPDDLLGLVVFDGGPMAVATPAAIDFTDYSFDFQVREGSDLAGALRYASRLFPPGARRRLVLVSDGASTGPDPSAVTRELRAAGVGVDVIPVAYRVESEVLIEAVDAPPQAAKDATVPVRIVLNATEPTSGRLDLLYEGRPIDINAGLPGTGRRITLDAGRNVLVVDVRLTGDRIHRLEPVYTPDDPAADRIRQNNRAETFTVTPGQGSVLVVDGVSDADPNGPGAQLIQPLLAAGIDVDLAPASLMPPDLLAMQAYDLVILQSVPVEDVPRRTQQALADYVRFGGGLVMVGGPGAFGPGGWKGSPIEPILPVVLDLPDQLISPTAAVAMVLDSSGSMARAVLGGSRTQQQIANDSAASAVEAMDPNDLICVIEFSSDVRVVWPLAKNADPQNVAAAIRSISPGGGTTIAPALFAAYERIRTAEAPIRHVILLTDGRDAGSVQSAPELAERMAADGVTVSTIAVGDDADADTLFEIAKAGRGAFYRVVDPNTLVRIFLKEIRVIRQPLIRLGRFDAVKLPSGSPVVAGLDAFPPLRGIVLTQARDDPRVVNAMTTDKGQPLLAHWFVGQGQVAAFTSDAHDWAREWTAWGGYDRFWTQLTRTLARPSGRSSADLQTQIIGDEMVIRLDAATELGDPLDLLTVDGLLVAPGGERTEIRLEQVDPGGYELRVPAPQRGNYVVALTPRLGSAQLPVVVGGATRTTSAEYQRLSSNVALMREIVEASGGRRLDPLAPDAGLLFDRDGLEPMRAASPIWRTLVIAALCVFIGDVATRRVAWDRLITRELVDDIREHAAEAVQQRTRLAAETAATLRRTVAPGPSRTTPVVEDRRTAAAPKAEAAPRSDAETQEDKAEAEAREARRRALRKQMLSRLGGAGDDDAPAPPSSSQADEPDEPSTSHLLAAKRRAAERYTEDPDPPA